MFFVSKSHNEFFSSPPDLNQRYFLIKRVEHEECSFSIESLSTLKKLLFEKKLLNEDPVLRFLVDTSGVAWFARETREGIKAPKHFQMTGAPQNKACCTTAGNIKFTNSNCAVLKEINHRSGDFQPSFFSLRVFLAILILNEKIVPFKLPQTLVVKELTKDGEVARKHKWPISKIKNWVASFSDQRELINQLMQQNVSTKKVFYESTMCELSDT